MDDKCIIINVGRQIGAGGRNLAKMLADDFCATFYDKELLLLAARESGLSERVFEQNDERKGFLKSLLRLHSPLPGDSFYQAGLSQDELFKFQSDAIRKAAAEGPCVFVGRCADYVLRDMTRMVSVFVTAPLDYRVTQVVRRHECSEQEARRIIEKAESQRATYYNYYTGKRWGAAESYDLCIDASLLGLEATEHFVAQFVRQRFGLEGAAEMPSRPMVAENNANTL